MNAKKLAYAEQKTSDILKKVIEATKSWEAEGKDAWTALRNLKGNNLADGDEIVIARRMYTEIKKLKVQLKSADKSLAEFCQAAGLGNEGDYSKEIYRLTLAPDGDPDKVKLRKSAAKYRQLIEQLSKETKVSSSVIANRVLVGTKLHPAEAVARDEVEQVQTILQTMVDIVDKEFGLYATYMETAKLKAEHAKEGGELRWPHINRESRLLDFGGTLSLMRWPGETLTLTPELTEIRKEIITREIEHAINEKNAFWSYKFGYYNGYIPPIYEQSGCVQDESFFYVPHVYVGYIGGLSDGGSLYVYNSDHIEDISGLNPEKDNIKKEIRRAQEDGMPEDNWDSEKNQPIGQFNSYWSNYHAWIVIYPTPDHLRLMPMLYIAFEEGGPYLLPLDAPHLNTLRKGYCLVDGEIIIAFEHIKTMLGYKPGSDSVIFDSFRRTSPWLKHNPFYKLKLAKETEQQALANYYAQLISEHQKTQGE